MFGEKWGQNLIEGECFKGSVIQIWLQKMLVCWGSGCCMRVSRDGKGGREIFNKKLAWPFQCNCWLPSLPLCIKSAEVLIEKVSNNWCGKSERKIKVQVLKIRSLENNSTNFTGLDADYPQCTSPKLWVTKKKKVTQSRQSYGWDSRKNRSTPGWFKLVGLGYQKADKRMEKKHL